MSTVLEVENLSVNYKIKGEYFFQSKKVEALTDVSFNVNKNDAFGIIGESGCGKSTIANAILGIVPTTSGIIRFMGQDLTKMSSKEFRKARLDMQVIFQDSFSSLNPRFNVFQIISEPMQIRGGFTKSEMERRVVELLELVGLSERDINRYPTDFSGGQRQRIGIARAISMNPKLLICDEPVSALDVSVHAQIINLLMDLREKLDITYIFISHNLASVREICNTMAVMYLGNIMENGITDEIFKNPAHPYTQALMSAVLDINQDAEDKRIILQGSIPSPINPPKGCRFSGRCIHASPECEDIKPKSQLLRSDHFAACSKIMIRK